MDKFTDRDIKQLGKFSVNYRETNDNLTNLFKYKAIKKIPYIFVIFVIIFLILVCVSLIDMPPTYKYILDKFINLITGIIIAISGVYLWSIRSEYHMIIQDVVDQYNKIYDNENLKREIDNINQE